MAPLGGHMESFVAQLKPLLVNPNAIGFKSDVLYLFTNNGELISVSI
jgi:hypothetical protein